MKLLKGSYLLFLLVAITALFVCSPPSGSSRIAPDVDAQVITTQHVNTTSILPASSIIRQVQYPDPPGQTPGSWLQYIAPLVVLLVTQIVKWFKKLPGWIIVVVVVPLTSALLAWLATLVSADLSWLQQFLFGLASIILFELQKQLRQGND